jgi:GxxExxY protein
MRIASPLSAEEERIMHQVIGSAISVHRALGPGFLESVYRRAVCIELDRRNLPYKCEHPIDVTYGEIPISGQRIDLIVGGLVIVELKAVARFEEIFVFLVEAFVDLRVLRGSGIARLRRPDVYIVVPSTHVPRRRTIPRPRRPPRRSEEAADSRRAVLCIKRRLSIAAG